jgi:hypothetical protein
LAVIDGDREIPGRIDVPGATDEAIPEGEEKIESKVALDRSQIFPEIAPVFSRSLAEK